MKSNTVAFTLVELIVVITITAILGTFGFLAFTRYSGDARDTMRATDVSSLSRVVNSHIDTGKFHRPESYIKDEFINSTLSQGFIQQQDITALDYSVGSASPLKFGGNQFIDPISNTPYPLAIVRGDFGIYYQVAASLEDHKALVKGNYFPTQESDLVGLIKSLDGTPVMNNSSVLPY